MSNLSWQLPSQLSQNIDATPSVPQEAEQSTQVVTGHGIDAPMLSKSDWKRTEPAQVMHRKDDKER